MTAQYMLRDAANNCHIEATSVEHQSEAVGLNVCLEHHSAAAELDAVWGTSPQWRDWSGPMFGASVYSSMTGISLRRQDRPHVFGISLYRHEA